MTRTVYRVDFPTHLEYPSIAVGREGPFGPNGSAAVKWDNGTEGGAGYLDVRKAIRSAILHELVVGAKLKDDEGVATPVTRIGRLVKLAKYYCLGEGWAGTDW